jgi:hypothetical protein
MIESYQRKRLTKKISSKNNGIKLPSAFPGLGWKDHASETQTDLNS